MKKGNVTAKLKAVAVAVFAEVCGQSNAYVQVRCYQAQDRKKVKGFESEKEVLDEAI